ncbi:MAG: histidine--tRNA ligase [Planctomycetota bacterium]|nr:MAG: histidine--tRNA ligase [Planctomycetota bacterium]
MAKRDTSPPRGMRDLLPAEVALRDRCEATIRGTYGRFGYQAVETPALEAIERLAGGQGGENAKLIYRVLKRGDKLARAVAALHATADGAGDGMPGRAGGDADKSTTDGAATDEATSVAADEALAGLVNLGLRFDLTVPLARYFAHNQGQLPAPFKALQIGPVWRAERPQKGRYRQFTQCDIDVLGEPSALAEIDLLEATTTTLAALGLDDCEVRLNDRRLLSALVQATGFDPAREGSVLIALDKLDKLGPDGVGKQLREAGHEAAAVEQLLAVLERGWDGLVSVAEQRQAAGQGEAAAQALASLDAIRSAHPGVRLDPSLVRGMGYYTGPIFEVGLKGYNFSLAGGGRYDDMIGAQLGRAVPACGFSIGFERVLLVLAERGGLTAGPERVALLADAKRLDGVEVLAAARVLRSGERVVSLLAARKNARAQLDELARHGFSHVARVGSGDPPELRPLSPAD